MKNENNNDNKEENRNILKPQKKYLSFNKLKAFERHPSVNGLMKQDLDSPPKEEKLNFFCVVKEEKENENENDSENLIKDNNPRKKSSNVFEFKIQKIKEKIFNDEIYYTKNENVDTNEEYKSEEKHFPNNHQLYEFSEGDKILDYEITKAIQKGEKEDVIINKINLSKKD